MTFIIKQSKMNTTILLDAGHGSIINGHYQTAGKRSPIWEDGSCTYTRVNLTAKLSTD